MGLLTSDRSSKNNRLFELFNNNYQWIVVLLLSLSVSAFLLLPSEHVADRTYFSDNALLPGLVQRQFAGQQLTSQTLKVLEQAVTKHSDRLPVELLIDLFRKSGLQAYEQKFTFTYPFGRQSKHVGRNVYAVLRASRTASTEAIVLSAPFRTKLNPNGSTLPGIALMISLAKYFASKSYWAKDIVFLVFEHELVGCQAWLDAYHKSGINSNDSSFENILTYDDLFGRSGQIQAAVNLELQSELSSRLDVKIEGFNGQLPNLDLFNVAVELATRESATPTFHGKSHLFSSSSSNLWSEQAKTLG